MIGKNPNHESRSGHSIPWVPLGEPAAATTERQPTEKGPVPFPECLNTDGSAKRLNCCVCHRPVAVGEMVFFIGPRPDSGALYRRHVGCARKPQKPRKQSPQVEPGGSAGPAANGRVVRSTRTFGG